MECGTIQELKSMKDNKYLEFAIANGYTEEQAMIFRDGIERTLSYDLYVLKMAVKDLKLSIKIAIGHFMSSCLDAYMGYEEMGER